jgi:hypothetical protein
VNALKYRRRTCRIVHGKIQKHGKRLRNGSLRLALTPKPESSRNRNEPPLRRLLQPAHISSISRVIGPMGG